MDVWNGLSDNRSAGQKKSPDYRDWNKIAVEVIKTQNEVNSLDGDIDDLSEAYIDPVDMVPETDVVAESTHGLIHKTVLSITDLDIVCADGSTKEFGSELLATFPAGAVHLLGVVADLSLESEDYKTAEEGDIALGTVAATDQALTSTDVTWLAAQAIAFSTDDALGEDTVLALGGAVAPVSDSEGDLEVHLNVAMDNGGGAGTVTVNGTVELYWVGLSSLQAPEE